MTSAEPRNNLKYFPNFEIQWHTVAIRQMEYSVWHGQWWIYSICIFFLYVSTLGHLQFHLIFYQMVVYIEFWIDAKLMCCLFLFFFLFHYVKLLILLIQFTKWQIEYILLLLLFLMVDLLNFCRCICMYRRYNILTNFYFLFLLLL